MRIPGTWVLVLPLLGVLDCRPKAPAPATKAEVQALVQGSNRLGLAVYHDLAKAQNGSLVLTPLGLCDPVAVLAWGLGDPEGSAALKQAGLVLPPDRVPTALEALRRDLLKPDSVLLPGQTPASLSVATALWSDASNPIPWRSRHLLPVVMRTEAANLEADGIREEMRQWIAATTGGLKVPNRLPSPAGGGLALVGTLHFKATWACPFRAEWTESAPFHRLDGSEVMVPLMRLHEPMPYWRDADCEATGLAYAGARLDLVILLPVPGRFRAVESGLDEARLNRILAGLDQSKPYEHGAQVFLPRFTIDSSVDLTGVLAHLGLGHAMSGGAPFPRLQEHTSHLPLCAEQISRFAVDEKGTEASSATIFITLGISKTTPFRADRPFLFLLRDSQTGALLYLGRYLGPEAPQG